MNTCAWLRCVNSVKMAATFGGSRSGAPIPRANGNSAAEAPRNARRSVTWLIMQCSPFRDASQTRECLSRFCEASRIVGPRPLHERQPIAVHNAADVARRVAAFFEDRRQLL